MSVSDRQQLVAIPEREIMSLVRFVLAAEGSQSPVEVALVDDSVIADLHRRFLGREGPTDVLAFPLEPEPGGSLGEVIVSTETAARQAPHYGTDPCGETMLCIVHGILHLLGYDDLDAPQRRRMERRQSELLEGWRELGGRDAEPDAR